MKFRVLISFVLIGLLAFAAGLGTVAYFTSTATSTDNTFTAGTLNIASPGTISSSLPVGNIFPGWESGTKTVTVSNTGSLDFKYRISVAALTGNRLYDGVTPLQVSVNGGDFKDISKLGYVELGTIAAQGTGTFTIAFKLPATADNAYQGATGTFQFVFDATQTNNTGWNQ